MDEHEWMNSTDPQAMLAFLRDSGKLSERKGRLFACACVRCVWPLLTDEGSRTAVELAENHADGQASDRQISGAAQAAARADAARSYGCSTAQNADGYGAAAAAAAVAQAYPVPWAPELGRSFESMAAEAAARASGSAWVANAEARLSAWEGGAYLPTPEETAVTRAGAAYASVGDRAAGPGLRDLSAGFTAVWQAERAAQAMLARDIFGNPFRAPPVLAPSYLTPAVVALAQDIYDRRSFERTRELADALEAIGCADVQLLEHLRGPGPHVRGCFAVDAVLAKM